MIMNKLAYETTLLTVCKMIAIVIGDLFSNGDRDRDCDLKFDQDRDRDRDRNFRDRGHALLTIKIQHVLPSSGIRNCSMHLCLEWIHCSLIGTDISYPNHNTIQI